MTSEQRREISVSEGVLSERERREHASRLMEFYKTYLYHSPEFAKALHEMYFDDSYFARRDYHNRRVTFPRGSWVYEILYENSPIHRDLMIWRSSPVGNNPSQWSMETVRVTVDDPHNSERTSSEKDRISYYKLSKEEGKGASILTQANTPDAVHHAEQLLRELERGS